MRAKKEMRHDVYKCSILGDNAHIEILYAIHTDPDRERLEGFECAQCTKCGVGIRVSAWETKMDWKKCGHPLRPKA